MAALAASGSKSNMVCTLSESASVSAQTHAAQNTFFSLNRAVPRSVEQKQLQSGSLSIIQYVHTYWSGTWLLIKTSNQMCQRYALHMQLELIIKMQKARESTCWWQGCLQMQPTCSQVIFKELGEGRFVTCRVRKCHLQVLIEGQLDFSTACQPTHSAHRSCHAGLYADMLRICKLYIVPMQQL